MYDIDIKSATGGCLVRVDIYIHSSQSDYMDNRLTKLFSFWRGRSGRPRTSVLCRRYRCGWYNEIVLAISIHLAGIASAVQPSDVASQILSAPCYLQAAMGFSFLDPEPTRNSSFQASRLASQPHHNPTWLLHGPLQKTCS